MALAHKLAAGLALPFDDIEGPMQGASRYGTPKRGPTVAPLTVWGARPNQPRAERDDVAGGETHPDHGGGLHRANRARNDAITVAAATL
jgi:hypothetical protein